MFGRKRPSGFTIIELLVVMAIIMILIGILIPVLASARAHALNAKCAGHMRTWGQTIVRYASAHDGDMPPITEETDSLYAASATLMQFFEDEELHPDIAYCPVNANLYGGRGADRWGSVEIESTGAVDFSPGNALVLVNNIPDNSPTDLPIPDILVDNSDTGDPDNYYVVSGPATPTTMVFPSGYEGANYEQFACVAAGGGGGSVEVIVDNETIGANDYFELTGTYVENTTTKETTYSPGYYATNYRWLLAEAAPGTETELFVIDNKTTGANDYFEMTGAYVENTTTKETTYSPGYHATNYRWIICEGPAATSAAVWHFQVPTPPSKAPGQEITLKIQGNWPKSATYCVSDATFKVVHEKGEATVTFNQQTQGAEWLDLGTYTFKCGQSYRVELDNSSATINGNQKYVYVDAIRGMFTSGGAFAATWNFTIPDPGGMAGEDVDVVIDGNWPASATYAVTDANFVVYHEGGSSEFTINQRTVGGDWHNFGTFTCKYGSTYHVEVGNASAQLGSPAATNKYVYTDAIRATIDGGGEAPSFATWHFKVPDPGGRNGQTVSLKVEGKWPSDAGNCVKDATFTITHEGTDAVVVVDQQDAATGGSWQDFGSYNFVVGQSYTVQLTNESSLLADPAAGNTNVHADAIRVTDPANSGDNLPTSGFAALTPDWGTSDSNGTAYDTGTPWYRYATVAGPVKEAAWVFEAPDGLHTVYGWWPKSGSYANSVPFTIHERTTGTQIASASMSQQDGGEWIPIATCTFTGGEDYYVKISSSGSGGTWVIADAIAIPKIDSGGTSTNSVFGYLYLGARTGLPPAPDGAPEPATPVQLVGNIKAFPAGTPILVDWMSDTPDFTSHGDYAHVLMLDMSVQRVNFGDAKHRWTSEKGTKFFW